MNDDNIAETFNTLKVKPIRKKIYMRQFIREKSNWLWKWKTYESSGYKWWRMGIVFWLNNMAEAFNALEIEPTKKKSQTD